MARKEKIKKTIFKYGKNKQQKYRKTSKNVLTQDWGFVIIQTKKTPAEAGAPYIKRATPYAVLQNQYKAFEYEIQARYVKGVLF